MAQPTPYTRQANFTNQQTLSPSDPLAATDVDAEFNAIAQSIGEIVAALRQIQRDDSALRNQVVTPESFSSDAASLIGDWNPRGDWATATDYLVRDLVLHGGDHYVCLVAHSSGTFSTDLIADKWMLFPGGVDTAADVPFVPAGSVAATDLQAAIAELDVDATAHSSNTSNPHGVTAAQLGAMEKSQNLDDVANKATARTNLVVPGLQTANAFTKTQTWATAAVASASTLDLSGLDGNAFSVTGTAAIGTITGLPVGTVYVLTFSDALTFSHHATNLILPGAANITTAAGDIAIMHQYATDDARCISYQRANGLPALPPPMLVAVDEKASGTNAGTSTASTWVQRDLNTERVNTIAGASVSGNQFTLPAGTYDIEFNAPGYYCNHHKLRVYNVTDGAAVILGQNAYNAASSLSTQAYGRGSVTITANKTFRVDHWTGRTQGANGLGVAQSIPSTNEVYTTVTVRRLA